MDYYGPSKDTGFGTSARRPISELSDSDVERARRTICALSASASEALSIMQMCGIAPGDVQTMLSQPVALNTSRRRE